MDPRGGIKRLPHVLRLKANPVGTDWAAITWATDAEIELRVEIHVECGTTEQIGDSMRYAGRSKTHTALISGLSQIRSTSLAFV